VPDVTLLYFISTIWAQRYVFHQVKNVRFLWLTFCCFSEFAVKWVQFLFLLRKSRVQISALERVTLPEAEREGPQSYPFVIFVSISYNCVWIFILYYTILYYTILYYTILHYTTLHYTTLYYTILYYTILYYTILYYTILYYTIYQLSSYTSGVVTIRGDLILL